MSTLVICFLLSVITKGNILPEKDIEKSPGKNRVLRLQNGEIALFCLRKNYAEDCMSMIRFSNDEAKTWEKVKNFEEDPDRWYCYTAIHFTGKNVLLGHCAGNRPAGTGLDVTQITRLSRKWIYR